MWIAIVVIALLVLLLLAVMAVRQVVYAVLLSICELLQTIRIHRAYLAQVEITQRQRWRVGLSAYARTVACSHPELSASLFELLKNMSHADEFEDVAVEKFCGEGDRTHRERNERKTDEES